MPVPLAKVDSVEIKTRSIVKVSENGIEVGGIKDVFRILLRKEVPNEGEKVPLFHMRVKGMVSDDGHIRRTADKANIRAV